MNDDSVASIAKSLYVPVAQPSQNVYSLLTAFSVSCKLSHVLEEVVLLKPPPALTSLRALNLPCERYPQHPSDSKSIAKIRVKMGSAIEEQHLLAGVQTGEAPGCTLGDLRVLVQETAIKGVKSGHKSLHDGAYVWSSS
ncbi:unnamed protein product [Phytophthora fragariaefolia]|uniref:Unnamed protein product n=1 Tax=Phytophthora fragariaefolia TaxID=1490495 RepID=A0A9W6YH31_9STRA|nr:unnamed protein product [Phytophthora fragariaefolia]